MQKETILIVNQTDLVGGAARNSWDLFQGLRRKGASVYMAVGQKSSIDPNVKAIPRICPSPFPWSRLLWNIGLLAEKHVGKVRGAKRLRSFSLTLSSPKTELQKRLGWEDFNYPGSRRILNMFDEEISLVHLHNLHMGYFDLTFLPELSKNVPTVLTLLDTWLFAGHCGYSLGCDRWLSGCGHCPYLSLYSPIPRDATAFNWKRKKDIYAKSQLYVAVPCQWMSDRLAKSILQQAVHEVRIIPSGTDQSIFYPADRQEARRNLGLPSDAYILLFVAQGIGANPFKNYAMVEQAIQIVSAQLIGEKIVFLSLGSEDNPSEKQNATIRHIPYTQDTMRVAQYYQAADIYLHAAHEDTFPNVILEAMSCGIPVIATQVGGIPEQIIDGRTGFLVPPQDAGAMAQRILTLIKDKNLSQLMRLQAYEHARRNFSLDLAIDRYQNFYTHVQEIYERG